VVSFYAIHFEDPSLIPAYGLTFYSALEL